VCECVYVCVCMCVCVCMYVCVYVCACLSACLVHTTVTLLENQIKLHETIIFTYHK
jgi:hypothetical protein